MPPHWSYSALHQYLECPLRYFFQRVLDLPVTSQPSSLVSGSSVHAALAEYHRTVKQGLPADRGKLHGIIIDTWNDRQAASTVTYKLGESKADDIAKAVALVEAYLRESPPENIVGIEQQLIATVSNSRGEMLSTPLMTVIDLVTAIDEGIAVTEFKTRARSYSDFETETSLQATCYAAAILETSGKLPRVDYVVLVKTKTPKIQRLQTSRTKEDIGRLGDIIQNVKHAIERDIFYPIENPIHCSGCPYRRQCREWGRSFSSTPTLADGDVHVG
jgi:CRISPR/Cas system-associated exonuclease Cas4 (RecB family)